MARGRQGYIESTQKDGGFCPHLESPIAKRIDRYCRVNNLNKTKFVTECLDAQLRILEKDIYKDMSKEELIDLLLSM